mgnify:CR=1 FL=1
MGDPSKVIQVKNDKYVISGVNEQRKAKVPV